MHVACRWGNVESWNVETRRLIAKRNDCLFLPESKPPTFLDYLRAIRQDVL